MTVLPPKPTARAGRVSLWQYKKLFRADILSAQPARLYRAWMAEFRTPFFRSFLVNQPDLIKQILRERSEDFPKSNRISDGLRGLLGDSVFVTNGEQWKRQRRIIDPAFEGGRLRDSFPGMWQAGQATVNRLRAGKVDIEAQTSHAAADVIFRTLFSIPIEDETAHAVFRQFQTYQRSQPILNLAALFPVLRRVPQARRGQARKAEREIRRLIGRLTEQRRAEIARGRAPDDLATRVMQTPDPLTGERFDTEEMVDQVVIFFLAGHETSASALAWALYLVACFPEWQDMLAEEAAALDTCNGNFAVMSELRLAKDVFREALRLYPPVPMMVREVACPTRFRERDVPKGAQIVLSPWHLHRHERLWDNPDGFDPGRWAKEHETSCPRDAFLPFSTGPRACPGAGFAMIEGPLLLAMIVRAFRIKPVLDREPVPMAHLTVRSRNGIWLELHPR